MAITKQKKEDILKELNDWVKKAKVVVFVNFHGLTNVLSQELRRLMRGSEARYLVAKKTLVKKVLDEAGFSGEMPVFDGELGLVFGEGDVVSPVKNLFKFTKAHAEVVMVGGVLSKSYLDKTSVIKLAELPSREVLLAQFLGVANSPVRGLVGVLSGAQRNLVNVLSQIKSQKK